MNPPEGQRDVRGGKTNRRKRKPSHPPRKGRQNSRWGTFTPTSEKFIVSDILIAGEPTIMGGLTDDDERPITRIENIENSDPNLDPAAALHDSIKAERE